MSQQSRSTFTTSDPSEIVQALVGLKDVVVLSYERFGPKRSLTIERPPGVLHCDKCGTKARVKDRPLVTYIDLPVYGQPMALRWKKHRMRCPNRACPKGSWMHADHRIGAAHCLLTTRAAKWATAQVGVGRTVNEVAGELGCDWHTVQDAVTLYGTALLAADRKRRSITSAIGLDETSFVRRGRTPTTYITTVADVANHQIVDLLPSRDFREVAAWVNAQPTHWRDQLHYGALDMSDAYAAVYSVTLPKVVQVVDPFHVIALATRCLDAIRRRVQVETTGHRGRRNDPLFQSRRLLQRAEESLSEDQAARLASLLELGDPGAEVAIAYRIKERLRDFYRTKDPDEARAMLSDLVARATTKAMPREIQRLGRTLKRWFDKICNHHLERITNAPTESINNLIKRIKRIGFGFRNFENYRIRVLLYAGKPNWRVLGSIVVR